MTMKCEPCGAVAASLDDWKTQHAFCREEFVPVVGTTKERYFVTDASRALQVTRARKGWHWNVTEIRSGQVVGQGWYPLDDKDLARTLASALVRALAAREDR